MNPLLSLVEDQLHLTACPSPMSQVLTSSPVMVLSSHAQMYVSTTAFGSAAYLYARRRSRDPLTRICAGFFTVVILRALACMYDLRLPQMV